MAVRKLPKDVLKMASGLILPSGLAGHRRPLCTGDLCRSCLDQPQLAERFLHHEHCPQGWVYSQASSMCFKSFNEIKPWKYAVRYCDYGGGRLGQAKNSSSLQIVLEAINLRAPAGEYWLGGKENVVGAGISGWPNEYVWTGDRTLVDDDNWPTGYPVLGFNIDIDAQSSFIWTPNYPNNYDNNYGQVRTTDTGELQTIP